MNNIVKKNIIYSLSSEINIPNKGNNDISLRANQIINSTTINNSLRKMIDNDLYIERDLLDKANYTDGPNEYSYDFLSSSSDGSKMWSELSCTQLSVIHKHETPIQNTLVRTNLKSNVSFITQIGELIAGTDTGIWRSKDGNQWDNRNSAELSDKNITTYLYSDDNLNPMMLIGTTDGLYEISNSIDIGNIDTAFQIQRKDNGIFSGKRINRIYKESENIYVCSEDGIFSGRDQNGVVSFTQEKLSVDVTDMSFLDNGGQLVGTRNNGLYERFSEYGFQNKTKIDIPDSRSVSFIKNNYIATESGLLYINNDAVDVDPFFSTQPIKCIYRYNARYTFIATDSNLYIRDENNDDKSSNVTTINDVGNINAICDFDGALVFTTELKIYYYRDIQSVIDNTDRELHEATGLTVGEQITASNKINDAIVFNKQLYISTTNNMYLFDYITSSSVEQQVIGSMTEKINFIKDFGDYLAIGTANGLYKYVQTSGLFTLCVAGFNVIDAVYDSTNQIAYCITSSNLIYSCDNDNNEVREVIFSSVQLTGIDLTYNKLLVLGTGNLYYYGYDSSSNKIDFTIQNKIFDEDDTRLEFKFVQHIDDDTFIFSNNELYILNSITKYGMVESFSSNGKNSTSTCFYSSDKESTETRYFISNQKLYYLDDSNNPVQLSNIDPKSSQTMILCDAYNGDRLYMANDSILSICNAYFDDNDKLSSISLITTNSSAGYIRDMMYWTNPTDLSVPELSSNFYTVFASSNGLYYNQSGDQEMTYSFGSPDYVFFSPEMSADMNTVGSTATNASNISAYVPPAVIYRSGSNINVISYDDAKNPVIKNVVKSDSVINNSYRVPYVEYSTARKSVNIENNFLVATSNGLSGGTIFGYANVDSKSKLSSMYVNIEDFTLVKGTQDLNVLSFASYQKNTNCIIAYPSGSSIPYLYYSFSSLPQLMVPKSSYQFFRSQVAFPQTNDIAITGPSYLIYSKTNGIFARVDLRNVCTLTGDDLSNLIDPRKISDKVVDKLYQINDTQCLTLAQNDSQLEISCITGITLANIGVIDGYLKNIVTNIDDIQIYVSNNTGSDNRRYSISRSNPTSGFNLMTESSTAYRKTSVIGQFSSGIDNNFIYVTDSYSYYHDIGDSNSIVKASNFNTTNLISIDKTSDSTVYAATTSKIYKFENDIDILEGEFSEFPITLIPGYGIQKLYIDGNNVIYVVSTSGNNVDIQTFKDNEIIQDIEFQTTGSSIQINDLYVDNTDVYLLTSNGIFQVSTIDDYSVRYHKTCPSSYGNFNDITSYENNLLVATDIGLMVCDNTGEFTLYNPTNTKITKIHNCGSGLYISNNTGVSQITQTAITTIEKYNGQKINAYYSDELFGTDDGLKWYVTVYLTDITKDKTLGFTSSTDLQIIDNKLTMLNGGRIKYLRDNNLIDYYVGLDDSDGYVTKIFNETSYMIYVNGNKSYHEYNLIDNQTTPITSFRDSGTYKWFISGNALYRTDGFNQFAYYNRIENTLNCGLSCTTQILNLDDDIFLIGTDNGLYKYILSENVEEQISNSYVKFIKLDDSTLDEYTSEPIIEYSFNDSNILKQLSENLYEDPTSLLHIWSGNTVNDYVRTSKYEYVIGGSNGVYKTSYQFTVTDDFYTGTVQDINDIISVYYDSVITEHIENYHNEDSTITILNTKKMPVDCSDISSVMNNNDIKNVVDQYEYENYMRYIRAKTSHAGMLSAYDQSDIEGITYIRNKYLRDGIQDIYIHIPTTNTYYVQHVNGVPNCTHDDTEIYQKNTDLTLSRNINDNVTELSVYINKEHFAIDRILGYSITGSSLPLKIFKGDSSNYYEDDKFSSFIKPSLVKSLDYTEYNDNIVLKFLCFGTDEQSIKLTTNTIVYYYIRYNLGKSTSGIMKELQQVRSDRTSYIQTCDYVRVGAVCTGWESQYRTFNIGDEIGDIDVVDGQVIDLYPIYQTYLFDTTSDTLISITTTTSEFTLNGDIGYCLGNVLVDYDFIKDTNIEINGAATPTDTLKIASGHKTGDNIDIDWNY